MGGAANRRQEAKKHCETRRGRVNAGGEKDRPAGKTTEVARRLPRDVTATTQLPPNY